MFIVTWLMVSLLLNVVLACALVWEMSNSRYMAGVAVACATPKLQLPALKVEEDLWPKDEATCKVCEEVVDGFLTIKDSDGRQVCTTCACW